MTQDQRTFLHEILSHPKFRPWAVGEAPEMDDFWNQWVSHDPAKNEVLLYAKSLISTFHQAPDGPSDEDILNKIKRAVSFEDVQPDNDKTKTTKRHGPAFRGSAYRGSAFRGSAFFLKIAAAVLLALGLTWTAYVYYAPTPVATEETPIQANRTPIVRTVKNTTASRQHILLADGSSVVLQPGTTLQYPETFSDSKREVHLTGEAFFEVVKNKEVPFYVKANQTIAQVIGTSFRIKAKPGSSLLEVNVKTGSVAIFKEKKAFSNDVNDYPPAEITVLKENQKAIFELAGDALLQRATIEEMPARLAIEQLSFVYESTPLSTVFNDLEAAYGVSIRYAPELFLRCSLTAELGDEPLTQKMKWIATILEVDYSMEGNEITLDGNPCQ